MRAIAFPFGTMMGKLSLVAALLVFAASCVTTSQVATNPPGGEEAITDSEILQAGDLLKISFRGPANMAIPDHDERIPESGEITLQHIGKVKAVGKTRVELQDEIRKAYVPKYYVELGVTIAPAERFFYVSGEVRKPDRHPYLGELTLTKAITAAGDFTDFAAKKRVQITRSDGRVEKVNFFKAQENPTQYDVKIFPNDKIHVPRRLF